MSGNSNVRPQLTPEAIERLRALLDADERRERLRRRALTTLAVVAAAIAAAFCLMLALRLVP